MSGGMTGLLALSFANPALLGGLGLVALPIIIHLLARRQFRTIDWAATRFLLEADKKNRRRVRFEQWLLVALRCAALALLALVVARPFTQSQTLAGLLGGGERVSRYVLLDDSASLQYQSGREGDFDQQRAAAERLLDALERDNAVGPLTVMTTSHPETPLAERAPLGSPEAAALRERLTKLQAGAAPAQPERAVRAIADAIASAETTSRAEIWVFSDFQRSEWAPPGETASVFAPLESLVSRGVQVKLVRATTALRDNVGIVSATLDRPQTIVGVPALLRVQVENDSPRQQADLSVQPTIDGASLPPAEVDPLSGGATATVNLELTFAETGVHVVELDLGAIDPFAPDNTRRLVVETRAALRVLLVDGAPSSDAYLDEVYLLRTALAPPGQFSSGIEVDVISPAALETTELSSFDVVMLCNTAAPSDAAVAALERYVQRGGGLAVFPGDSMTDVAEFNRALFNEGRGLLPAALDVRRTADEPIGIFATRPHPVTAMLPDSPTASVSLARFARYFQVELPESPALEKENGNQRGVAEVLARYTDAEQSPAIILAARGAGRVMQFTSTVDLDWNSWARAVDGSYVVTMLELVQYLARRPANPAAFTAGERLWVELSPDEFEAAALFKSPAFPTEPAVEATAPPTPPTIGEPVRLTGPTADRLGRYAVELSRKGAGAVTRPVVVNIDPRETNLAIALDRDLSGALGDIPHTILGDAQDLLTTDRRSRRELWPLLLVLMVVVLFSEQALAWWFGQGGRAARSSATPQRRWVSRPQPVRVETQARPLETSRN